MVTDTVLFLGLGGGGTCESNAAKLFAVQQVIHDAHAAEHKRQPSLTNSKRLWLVKAVGRQ